MTTMTENHTTAQDTVYALAAAGRWVYAGRASGVYRSPDGGASWQDTFAALDERFAITALAAHDESLFAGVKGGILRSDDSGDHWQTAGLGAPPPQVVALALSPGYDADGMVFAGTAEDGVFVSTDRGASWVPWNFGLFDPRVYALAVSPQFATDRTLYAGTESGIFYSRNAGRSWRDLPFPRDAAPVLSLALLTDSRLLAGSENGGLLLTADAGANWRQVSATSGTVNALHLATDRILALLDDRLLTSADAESWQDVSALPPERAAVSLLGLSGTALVGFADGVVLQIG